MNIAKLEDFYRNKVVLLTGATGGIGRALSIELAKFYPRLMLLSRNVQQLKSITAAIEETTEVDYLECDVRDSENIKSAVVDTVKKWRRIDIAILCAGIDIFNTIDSFSAESYRIILATNFLQAVDFFDNLLHVFRNQGEGRIVAISSLVDSMGLPFCGAYTAGKAALSRFLESVRTELRLSGIGVTIIRPGFVDTPMTKMNNFKMPLLMTPEIAAKKIAMAIYRERNKVSFPFFSSLGLSAAEMLPGPILDYICWRYYLKMKAMA